MRLQAMREVLSRLREPQEALADPSGLSLETFLNISPLNLSGLVPLRYRRGNVPGLEAGSRTRLNGYNAPLYVLIIAPA